MEPCRGYAPGVSAVAAPRSDGLRRDLPLALGFLIVWMTGYVLLRSNGWQPHRPESWVVCGAFTAVAIACFSTLPVIGLLTVALGYPAVYRFELQSQIHLLPLLLAGFAASLRRLPAAFVWTATLIPIGLLSAAWAVLINGLRPNLSAAVLALFSGAAVCALGGTVAKARRQAAILAERNAELIELRALDAERAVIEERARIARELHDIVAHSLTGIIVRAQAADRVAESEPGAAREAVRWIATSGKEALTAIRQTVKVLRDPAGGGPASRSPGPSLEVLPEMAARLEEAGLSVRLLLPPHRPVLDPTVELAAVRIVQESLTNVLSHARAKKATVDVLDTPGGLILTIDDDGVGDAEHTKSQLVPSGGHGLVGMRERAAACGGDVEFTDSPLGGWRVRAWLPKGGPE